MNFIITNTGWISLIVSLIGIGFAGFTARWLLAQDAGGERVQKIGAAIQRGARTFLSREYRYVAVLVIIVVAVLLVLSAIPGSGMSPWTALAFVGGGTSSGSLSAWRR